MTTPERPSAPQGVPQLLLERLVAGELPDALQQEVSRRLGEERGGEERRAALESSNREILAAYPAASMADEIRRRHRERSGVWAFWTTGVIAAAAAALVLIVARPGLIRGPEDPDGSRVKGRPRLTVYRKAAGGAELLRSGGRVQAGDLLQIGYNGGGASHGVSFSVDGRGTVTLHFPRTRTDPPRLEGGARVLPYAYELDDAPGFERFFFVTAESAIDVEELLRRARDLGANAHGQLELPAGMSSVDALLFKPASQDRR